MLRIVCRAVSLSIVYTPFLFLSQRPFVCYNKKAVATARQNVSYGFAGFRLLRGPVFFQLARIAPGPAYTPRPFCEKIGNFRIFSLFALSSIKNKCELIGLLSIKKKICLRLFSALSVHFALFARSMLIISEKRIRTNITRAKIVKILVCIVTASGPSVSQGPGPGRRPGGLSVALPCWPLC
jgi:hypothetical protein